MNKFEIEGNLARDAYYSEPKSKDGKATAIMTVAVSRTSASGTDFITVKLFGDLATAVRDKLGKGNHVIVTGYISTSSYQPKGSKEKIYSQDLIGVEIKKIKGSATSNTNGFTEE